MAPGGGGLADDARNEKPAPGDPGTQVHDPRPAEPGVPPQLRHRQPVAAVPLHRAGQQPGRRLDGRAAMTRVEDQRLHVAVEPDLAVDLRLDVAVQQVEAVRGGPFGEREARGDAEGGRVRRTVRVAERRPRQHLGPQPEVGRAEPRSRTDAQARDVQAAVDGAFPRGRPVVGAAEDPALPSPAVAPGAGGEPSIARARHELRQVDAVLREPFEDGPATREPVGVEVHRHAQAPVEGPARRPRGDVAQRPVLRRTGGEDAHRGSVARRPGAVHTV